MKPKVKRFQGDRIGSPLQKPNPSFVGAPLRRCPGLAGGADMATPQGGELLHLSQEASKGSIRMKENRYVQHHQGIQWRALLVLFGIQSYIPR